MGGNKTGLGDPVDRFQLLRGDECLRTRKQTHQLHVHVRQNHQRHKQQSERAVPSHNTRLTHRCILFHFKLKRFTNRYSTYSLFQLFRYANH